MSSAISARPLILPACLFVLLAAVAAPALAQVELRWGFDKGEKVQYEMVMDMTQEMTVMDQKLSTKIGQLMDMTWNVTKVDEDGTAVVTQTIDRVRVEITPPQPGAKTLTYDTAAEEQEAGAEVFGKLYGALTGHPITLTVTPLGEVKDIEFAPEIMEAIKEIGGPASSIMSEDTLKQMVGRSLFQFPEQVFKGESWDSEVVTANPILGKQIMKSHYTYIGPEEYQGRDAEKIDLKLEMSFEQPADAQAKVKITKQQSDGVLIFDNKQGLPLETDATSKVDMQLSVGGQSLDQAITTKVSMKQKPQAAE